MLPFSDRPKILQKLGRDFFFLVFKLQFLLLFVSKLAIISTWSFSLVVRIVLNPSVFSKKIALTIWSSSFAMHILFWALTLTQGIRVRKKKKISDRPTRPENVISKRATQQFFLFGLMYMQKGWRWCEMENDENNE